MSIVNLHRLFNPKTVAVIGASEKKDTVGFLIMKNLLEKGFKGNILPVNPMYDRIMGQKAFVRIEDADSAIDMAVIATPIRTVPEILESCGNAGLAGVVIISSGGKEIGSKGRKMEETILQTARKHHLRIIGPNCLGFVNTATSLNASFAHVVPLPGKMHFTMLLSSVPVSCGSMNLKNCLIVPNSLQSRGDPTARALPLLPMPEALVSWQLMPSHPMGLNRPGSVRKPLGNWTGFYRKTGAGEIQTTSLGIREGMCTCKPPVSAPMRLKPMPFF